MRLITLNIWGGCIQQPLLKFLNDNQAVDIFCFQEVYHNAPVKITDEDRHIALNIFANIQQALPDHVGFFQPVVNEIYGLAIYVKQNIHVKHEGSMMIYHNPNYSGIGPTHNRILQSLTYQNDDHIGTIVNVHGHLEWERKNRHT